MDIKRYNQTLFSFLHSSPTPFHAVENIESSLLDHGFIKLSEKEQWSLQNGRSYFVQREKAAIIAFTLGHDEKREDGFRILGCHTDSPGLLVKPQADIRTDSFQQLAVEVYGGALLYTWFDRDLTMAGRVCYATRNDDIEQILINFKRPLLYIPSIAIHFNREANKNSSIDKQKQLSPIISHIIDQQLPDFESFLIEQITREYPDAAPANILSFDIFCQDTQRPCFTGYNNEFISASRLDNLLSCHAGLAAITNADKRLNHLLFCANHEENGSISSTGADGSFIDAVFERIIPECEARRIAFARSFLLSMDNSHATHPNFHTKSDQNHLIDLNKGPVIKINANQRYATSALSSALFKKLCDDIKIPYQQFVMRNDMPCGSTIGPITAAHLGIKTIDIGAPTLAMHSIREHTGSNDPFLLYQTITRFLKSNYHQRL